MKQNQTVFNFLQELSQSALNGRALMTFADNVDGYSATLEAAPKDLETWLETMSASQRGPIAEVRASAFCSAALGPRGALIVTDPRLDCWTLQSSKIRMLLDKARDSDKASVGIIDDPDGLPVAVAVASYPLSASWPLQDDVRKALDQNRAQFALIAFNPRDRDWLIAARAYGLTPAETRLISNLARTRDLRAACEDLRIAYETGRKAVASVMAKTGTTRQPELLRETLMVTAGGIRASQECERLFADVFNLKLRQAKIARQISLGLTRKLAAQHLGMSLSSVKDDLSQIYHVTGVNSALSLARVFAEVEAINGLAVACDVSMYRGLSGKDPIRLIPRATRPGRIAIADHGPTGGKPVIIFHTSTGGRAQSPAMLSALRAGGYRSIVIERPGYGLTDPCSNDPWLSASHDVKEVLSELGIRDMAILARGGARPALVSAADLSGVCRGGVLIGPDTPAHLDKSLQGMMGRTKAWMFSNPKVISGLSTLLSNHTSTKAIEHLMRAASRGSAPDLALLERPEELDALVRGGRQSAVGRIGFAREMEVWAHGKELPSVCEDQNWSILFGQADPLFQAGDCEDWWRIQIPKVIFETIGGAGRFLASTHPEIVVAALDRVWTGQGQNTQ